jgi:ATP-binding cassette, subfamily B, bacterial HlyB/CyaB
VDISDGHISGPLPQGLPHTAQPASGGDGDDGRAVDQGTGDGGRAIHPRLQALIAAGRYYGIELDPDEFRNIDQAAIPSAASLSAWAQSGGMWSRAVRLRWRHLMRFSDTGPVVLLLADGTAALLTGTNHEHQVVLLKDPKAAAGDAPVPVDELRLSEVWQGETILLRANRSNSEADEPFSLRWLVRLVLTEKRSLRDIAIASLTLSFLTILPPFMVMTTVDKVLTHHSYSTWVLLVALLTVMVTY